MSSSPSPTRITAVITLKGGQPRTEVFEQNEITIGRVQGNDIVLPKGNLSKRHTRVVLRDGKLIVVDLKSTNGTFVNGKRISSPQVLKDGDKIYVGDFTLELSLGERATPPPARAPLVAPVASLPVSIGRYTIERELARGRHVVYEASDPQSARRVALKLLPLASSSSWSSTQEATLAFKREFRVLQNARHANVAAVFDAGHDATAGTFITLELADGGTARDFVDGDGAVLGAPGNGPPTEVAHDAATLVALNDDERRARIVQAAVWIASGLGALHARDVLHATLSPRKALLEPRARTIKIAGLSSARVKGAPAGNLIVGDMRYLAPEIALGNDNVDGRADLYSLGVMLYELVAGRHPFHADNAIGYAFHHARTKPPPITRFNPGAESTLVALIERMLAKDPEARPPNAAAVVDALASLSPSPSSSSSSHRSRAVTLDDDVPIVPPGRSS